MNIILLGCQVFQYRYSLEASKTSNGTTLTFFQGKGTYSKNTSDLNRFQLTDIQTEHSEAQCDESKPSAGKDKNQNSEMVPILN